MSDVLAETIAAHGYNRQFMRCECGDDLWQTESHATHVADVVRAAMNPVIDAAHLEHQREWSRKTFGPGERTAGVLDHIAKEMIEIRSAPWDVTEWADLLILAFDGAWRAGHEPQEVIDAIKAKQARNETREWPDWRTADPNKAIEHVRQEVQ